MQITIRNFKEVIENSNTFRKLQGTDKFKRTLLLNNYRNIYNDYEQAKRLGFDYVVQYMTSSTEVELIKELLK